jgi:glutathione synthase/RimK-type ligase-like ATP-grasp enzyme
MHGPTSARVGFVTSEELRTLTPDDRSVVPVLAGRGVEVVPVVWTEVLPRSLDGLVLRSTWDYHLRLADFLGWVDGTETARIPLLNRPSTIRWNVDKKYLLEIEARGVPIVPTRHAARGSTAELPALLRDLGWTEAVVKPTVSGGAFETWRAGASEDDAARFARQLEAMDCLVQPFVPELISAGEWSLLFFGGAYSHAVLKQPEPGDFRVQEEFGGLAVPVEAPPAVIAAATRALQASGQETVYARVDGVVRGGRFEVMELELVEPSLFLETSPGAAERFADALVEHLGRASR